MPGTPTTGSSNISLLDSRIIADLCLGNICVDLSPSIYIGSGKNNVLGANVQITNPFGVVIKPYGNNYEISPVTSGGMDAAICIPIPTAGSVYQWGRYKVDVQLFDGSLSWVNTKYVTICQPDRINKNRNYGTIDVLVNGTCAEGKLGIVVDNVPTYNGVLVQSQVINLTLKYPTASQLPPIVTNVGSFSVVLFEGEYLITGTVCATYNFGDNVYVNVLYKFNRCKNVRCTFDECCVNEVLSGLDKRLHEKCSDQERERITNTIFDSLSLLKLIELDTLCDNDPSDHINELEKLLGCKCTDTGAPVINPTPSSDISIEGCNVTSQVVGLTTIYTINNYDYIVEVQDNGGCLYISAPTVTDCTKSQTIIFDIAAVYTKIKALANNNNTEADFWGSIVNTALRNVDPTCLGISGSTWSSYSIVQKFNTIMSKVCGCCGCNASVSNVELSQSGNNVIVSWNVSNDTLSVDLYLDGIFQTKILTPVNKTGLSFTMASAADGAVHTFTLVPTCSNNTPGNYYTDDFIYLGCPDIAPPVVSSNVINGVECPYDLTGIVTPPPAGITVEWHTANNTNGSSLVADPTRLLSGIYYAFCKDSNGCYSISTQVTLICEAGASCTAPQNLFVTVPLNHGPALVTFQSAAFPPPGNSYTVKRKLASDPDIDGSYTTLGSPTFNSGTGKWQILDNSYADNTLYTYKAISNCGGSPGSTPAVYYTYAHIICAGVDATPSTDHIDYTLSTTGSNQIDKYTVSLFDATGTILIHTDTYTPAFANPLSGTFTYLTPNTTYKIIVTAFIGEYSTSCSTTILTTTPGASQNYSISSAYNFSIDSVTGTGVPPLPPTGLNHTEYGHQAGLSGTLQVILSGSVVTTTKLDLIVNGHVVACQPVSGPGTYNLTLLTPTVESDNVQIDVDSGGCVLT